MRSDCSPARMPCSRIAAPSIWAQGAWKDRRPKTNPAPLRLECLPPQAHRWGRTTNLRAEINEDAWTALYQTTSMPFPRSKTGKIAVKVINHYGDEVLKVFKV